MALPVHRQGSQQRHSTLSEDPLSFGAWLRHRRRALDLTQAELAHRVGCARITIRRLEADELKPSRELAELLAVHIGITPAQQDTWLRAARGVAVPLAPPYGAVPPPTATPLATIEPPVEIALPSFLQQPVPFVTQPRLFVAREHELAQLQRLLDLACAGQGRVAFVTGEAGSGKSTLVQEFARRAQLAQPDLVVATGTCQAFAGIGDPYLPFRELLAMLTGDVEDSWVGGTLSRAHVATLWSLLPQVVSLLLADTPNLIGTFITGAALLQRAQMAAPAGASWLTQLAAFVAAQGTEQASRWQQQDLFAQTTRFLLGLARHRPLLLCLDDLQWADAGSLHLLFHLGRQLLGSRILLLGLYRPTDVALGRPALLGNQPSTVTERHPLVPVVAELQRTFDERAIDLQHADGHTFIQALLAGMPHHLSPTFTATLYQHTEGQALFTVELLRALQARGDLVQDGQGAWLEGPTLNWETLPAQVEGMISERIGRVPSLLQSLLTIAAVEGETFTAEVIATVQGISDQRVIQELSNVLDKQHGLVHLQEVQRFPAARLSRYRFRHHLFQTYLYQRLDAAERATLHEAVGQALLQRYGEQNTEVMPQLARHFELAGLPEMAITYLIKAGEQARCVYLNTLAIDYFQRAWERLESLPSQQALNKAAATVANWRFTVLVGLGKAYYGASKLVEAESCFRQAITIPHALPLPVAMTARLYYWLAEILFWQHRYAEQLAAGEAGLRLLEDNNGSTEAALIHYSMALSHRWLGNPACAHQLILHNAQFLAALPYSEELREPYLQIVQFYTRVQQELVTARYWLETLRRHATSAHDLRALARTAHLNAVEVLEYSGDLRGAAQEFRLAIHYFAQIGDDKYEMNCLSRLGWTLIRNGQLDAAEASLADASRKAAQLGQIHGFDWGYANWGLIQLCRGDWQAAAVNLNKTLALIQPLQEGSAGMVWIQLLWARLHLLRGEGVAARSRLDTVQRVVEQMGVNQLSEIDKPDMMRLLATLEEAYGPAVLSRYGALRRHLPTLVCAYLAPAQPDLDLAPCVSVTLDTPIQLDHRWTWCDPFGDGRYTFTTGVTLWAANGRDLYGYNRSAPRLLQPVCDEFVAQTRCGAASVDQPAIGGLLLWGNEQNYLFLTLGLLGPTEISWRGALAGVPVILGRGRLSTGGAYLRLERSNRQVRALCSSDGCTWFTAGALEFPVEDALQIGLCAVGDIDRWFYPGAYPNGTAIQFTEFTLMQRGSVT